ncbi:hypothetical protein Pint_33095 [Pistacia integerrima]|uniref:Uncharacterized protein n=1 Tax=Pistacia integerrima TaxID=434235 RepID=A0ACC0X688_9ROSI|nr:hypothetical protein Pint_33095 [Pistacia integerrima]
MDDSSILIYDIKFAKVKNKLINHQQKLCVWSLDGGEKQATEPEKIWWEYVTKEELFEHIGYTSELPSLLRNVSENVRDLLSKCLIKDFEDRWTAEELLQHPVLSVDA